MTDPDEEPTPEDNENADLEAVMEEGAARQVERVMGRVSVVSGLTKMERHWLIGYLVHGNATQAAEDAGYALPNKAGSRIRHKPHIQAAIDEYFHQEEMTAKEVIARLSQQAKAEYATYLRAGKHGRVGIDVAALLADGKGHLIKGVKETQYGQTIEFYDAHQALVDVGRYHGLFTDKTDANVAFSDSGLTVEEWRAEAAKRREEAAKTAVLFEDISTGSMQDVDTED